MKCHFQPRSLAASLGFFIGAFGAPLNAYATDKPDFVDTAVVCAEERANKDRLADQLLLKYPIGEQCLELASPDGPTSRRQALAHLIGNRDAFANKCQPADISNARVITAALLALLDHRYAPEYDVTQNADPVSLLNDNGIVIQCIPKKKQPPQADGPITAFVKQRLRIRGKENDLAVPRGEPDLANADKASFTLANDYELGKRTHEGQGYIGITLSPEPQNARRTDWIIYAGGKRSSVRVNGVDDTANEKRTLNGGLVLSIFRPGIRWDHAFIVRPDYLVDKVDHSRIASLRMEYTPYKPMPRWLGINTFQSLNLPLLPKTFAKLIFSVPFDAGHYVRRKDNAADGEQPNFAHLGARLGLGMRIDSDLFPIDFETRYTALRALRGDIDVNYLKTSLDVNLTEKGYLALGLDYSRGRLEDTFKAEKKWTVSLKGRY